MAVAVSEVATYTLAYFQTSHVRHLPIRNNHSRLVFCKQIKGVVAILRKQYGVPLLRKGLLDQFAIDHGIINC
jgi:hypothetical protein